MCNISLNNIVNIFWKNIQQHCETMPNAGDLDRSHTLKIRF